MNTTTETESEIDVVRDEIEHILEDVHDLMDLTPNHIELLKWITLDPFTIGKIKVSPDQISAWRENFGISEGSDLGFECQNHCIMLKGRRWLRNAIVDVIYKPLLKFQEQSNSRSQSEYKVGQLTWSQVQEQKYTPVFSINIRYNESEMDLFNETQRCLVEHESLQLIILIEIGEHNALEISSDDKWGLKEEDLKKMSHQQLLDHILKWYRDRNIALDGAYDLSVYLWYSNEFVPQCILPKITFSRSHRIDPHDIKDIPLRTESFVPDGWRENPDDDWQLFFPLRQIVESVQQGYEQIEEGRVAEVVINLKRDLNNSAVKNELMYYMFHYF